MNRSDAFLLFIDFLEQKKLSYGVLGNTGGYPQQIPSDVDFVVSRDVLKHIRSYIKEFCAAHGFAFIQVLRHESTAVCVCLAFYDMAIDQYSFIQLDFCSDFKSRGRRLLSCELLLNNLKRGDGAQDFWKLNEHLEFTYYLLKKVYKGQITVDQFQHLVTCWHGSPSTILIVLRDFFHPDELQTIQQAFDASDYALLNKNLKRLQRSLFKKKKYTVDDWWLNAKNTFNRIRKPAGLIVGVLGRDGTGKSTLINSIEEEFSFCYRDVVKYHLYPGFFLSHDKRTADDYTTPHIRRRYNKIVSELKLGFFLFEYFLGYWMKVYPKKLNHYLVIFDRYFVDVLVDPLRYRQAEKSFLAKLVHRLIPKPDMWLILDASTESVLMRKQELTFSLSETLRRRYLNLQNELSNAYVINADGCVQDVAKQASCVMIGALKEKV